MGTTYNIKFIGDKTQINQKALDSILIALNDEVSTYIPSSIISILNQSGLEEFEVVEDNYFTDNYKIAKELYDLTSGYFDVTLAPLVNFWGFGYTDKDLKNKDKREVPKLMSVVGFDKWNGELVGEKLVVSKPAKGQLDFSGSAKGYGVDIIAEYIEEQGVRSYYVEIGGELRVKGIKDDGSKWTVGINKPTEESELTDISKIVQLSNESMATSGNYRNFYKEDGITYSHIINPFTGFPERSTLLSATILHKQCAFADGFATACMVMGKQKCIELLQKQTDYQGLLLFSEDGETIVSWETDGFSTK
jgi:thiamine biosynthesis lipoprotein